MKIFDILTTLEANNSRNFKIEFLNQHKDNADLKQAIYLALNPMIQFYIRKIPAYSNTKSIPLRVGMDRLLPLSNRTVTGHAGINHLIDVLSSLEPDDAKVIERIIEKDLACGIAASTVNKVWEKLIPEWPCMTCEPFKEKFVQKIKFPAYVQNKEDGMRFNAIVKDGKVEFRSRNGKLISLDNSPIEADFSFMPGGIYDGELLVGLLDRKTGNGILNKAVKGTISEEEKKSVRAVIWDYITHDEFQIGGKSTTTYVDRLKKCSIPPLEIKNITKIKTDVVETYEDAVALFQVALEEKREGIILKDPTNLWEDKRSQKQIKFKNELQCELRVKGVKEHTEKPGTLGAFECESEDGVIEVSVGSGISDAQRKEYWEMNLLDKIVTVKYNERINNRKGKQSLFLPIFIELRLDKDVADVSGKIK